MRGARLWCPAMPSYGAQYGASAWFLTRELAVQHARGGLPPYVRRRIHDYIAAHLDQKLTNGVLAQIAGLSTTHFCAVFKQTEGMSPHRCVLQYRVRRTQQLLASTEMSLAEIADAVGFSSQSHCIQSFRKIVGVTPGHYRCCCLGRRAATVLIS